VFKPDFCFFQILSTSYRVVSMHLSSPITMVASRILLWQQVLTMLAQAISAAFVMTATAICYKQKVQQQLQRAGWRGLACARKGVSMKEVFDSLGPNYFWCSFWMSYKSFNKLLGILTSEFSPTDKETRDWCICSTACPKQNDLSSPAFGMLLADCWCIRIWRSACFLHQTSQNIKSIWVVTQAINQCRASDITYPTCHNMQRWIVAGFTKKSAAGFCCCTGTLDGILIWTPCPSEAHFCQCFLTNSCFFSLSHRIVSVWQQCIHQFPIYGNAVQWYKRRYKRHL
jgi:hypothetical protein